MCNACAVDWLRCWRTPSYISTYSHRRHRALYKFEGNYVKYCIFVCICVIEYSTTCAHDVMFSIKVYTMFACYAGGGGHENLCA